MSRPHGPIWKMAERYGVSQKQIYRYGISRFMALPEETRQFVVAEMHKTKTARENRRNSVQ